MSSVLVLSSEGASVRLLPHAGGRVSSLKLMSPTWGAVDVLHPYPEEVFDPIHWAKGGIYPLMPYSNRIADAKVRVDGEVVSLLAHPGAVPHTLHGNAHAQSWITTASSESTATIELQSAVSPAWPWRYRATQSFELTRSKLNICLVLCNTDNRVMPAGFGLHPYFRHQSDALLTYSASTLWSATPEFLAHSSRPLADHERYEQPRRLPDGGMTDYVGGWAGTLALGLPDGARIQMQADTVFNHLVVHRPDNAAYLCLEPVSHVANGFNLAAQGVAHTGTHLLQPGECLIGNISFTLLD
jgi:aldose 1-epimerase